MKNTGRSAKIQASVDALEKVLNYRFTDSSPLITALTHSSYANENGIAEHNERLEFLGDAVFELTVSAELFRRFPHVREGNLTRLRSSLVSRPALSKLALEIGLDKHLLLGRGEESQGGRERSAVLCDAMEACLAAVFLDGGYAAACKSVAHLLAKHWPQEAESVKKKDPKSALQERTQELFHALPVYTLLGSSGLEHERIFSVQLTLPNGQELSAEGASVKRAEQEAAQQALVLLQNSKA